MRYVILLVPLLALLALACDDGGEQVVTPTATAEPDATATPGPAAETLAFIRDGDVWLIDADGSNQRSLNLSNVESFAWISAAEIDVTTGDEPPRHLSVDLEGNVRELPFPAGGSWSRDGSLYVVPVDQEVVVFNRDGSEAARLEVEPPVEGGEKPRPCGVPLFNGEPDRLLFSRPVLSPDNRSVAVAVNCQSRAGASGNLLTPVTIVALDGSEQRSIRELQVNVGGAVLDFSPDGSRVAASDSFHISACASVWSLQVSDLAGTEVTAISLAAIEEIYQQEPRPDCIGGGLVGYDWSPSSNGVVGSFDLTVYADLTTDTPGPFVKGLYLLALDGSSAEQLVDGPARSPAWSPSGRYIAFVAQEFFGNPGPPIIHLLDMTTREVIDLGPGSQPAWRPQS